MESPQQLAFDDRRAQLARKVNFLKAYLDKLNKLRSSKVFALSDKREQALLDRVLVDFRSALSLVRPCAKTLMAFVAGMACFSCNPRWDDFVWRDATGDVSAVNVSGEACIHVDQTCGAFGRAARRIESGVMASGIAKTPTVPLPDLSMFKDRETVCAWLRQSLALEPLPSTIPGGTISAYNAGGVLESVGQSATSARILSQTSTQGLPTEPPYSTKPTQALEPVRDGEQSAFDIDTAATAIEAGSTQVDALRGRQLAV